MWLREYNLINFFKIAVNDKEGRNMAIYKIILKIK